jgi:hypothetical protein
VPRTNNLSTYDRAITKMCPHVRACGWRSSQFTVIVGSPQHEFKVVHLGSKRPPTSERPRCTNHKPPARWFGQRPLKAGLDLVRVRLHPVRSITPTHVHLPTVSLTAAFTCQCAEAACRPPPGVDDRPPLQPAKEVRDLLARLWKRTQIRLHGFPTLREEFFRLFIRNGGTDNHVVAVFPIDRCRDLELGRQLQRIDHS